MQNMNLAMVVLIAGLIIVFIMLILLTLIIKLYGTIIYKNQTNKKQAASKTKKTVKTKSNSGDLAGSTENNFVNSDDLSDEILAVISAAVASLGAADSKYYAVKSIKQSLNQATSNRLEWGMAGKLQNTKPFWH